MELIIDYFLYFIIYAFIGWCIEVLCKFIEFKKFVNRGFLIGPICPIYGYGLLLILLLIGNNKTDIIGVFLKVILVCSILEYITSYFMEKIFKARWWDYSRRKFNLNGRICLETMIPFGIIGCIFIYLIHPLITHKISLLSYNIKLIISILLVALYIVDNIISFSVMNKIKDEINRESLDSTEFIRDKVLAWIDSNSIFYRRIKKSFPKLKIRKIISDK